MQSSLAILNMRYLEFQDIWNFFRDPLRIYDLLPFKKSGYLEYSACGWTKFAYITLQGIHSISQYSLDSIITHCHKGNVADLQQR